MAYTAPFAVENQSTPVWYEKKPWAFRNYGRTGSDITLDANSGWNSSINHFGSKETPFDAFKRHKKHRFASMTRQATLSAGDLASSLGSQPSIGKRRTQSMAELTTYGELCGIVEDRRPEWDNMVSFHRSVGRDTFKATARRGPDDASTARRFEPRTKPPPPWADDEVRCFTRMPPLNSTPARSRT
mmetsp:Transcript_87808/g.246671  ORF Transcript_87808/g.246671 Transcript_87808/m.246671 type:complete len:186 (-) Transcript_87808:126-683(-)